MPNSSQKLEICHNTPVSEQFDDLYFSSEDGLAETQHVFLSGNNLPNAWKTSKSFIIAETGFGTGLNFLATAQLFHDTSDSDQKLHYISVEKFPLSSDKISEYLSKWHSTFPDFLDRLRHLYPPQIPGFHRIDFTPQISLTLLFDDANDALPRLSTTVDCWFLDGFKPSTNPEMWTDKIFTNMARLSRAETTFATFTAAGFVRRGLVNAGFKVIKTKGFGRKRDMLCGSFLNTGARE